MNIEIDINGVLFLGITGLFVVYWIGLAFHETYAEYNRYIHKQKKMLISKKKKK